MGPCGEATPPWIRHRVHLRQRGEREGREGGEREGGKRLAEKKLKLMKACRNRKKEKAEMAIDKHGEE